MKRMIPGERSLVMLFSCQTEETLTKITLLGDELQTTKDTIIFNAISLIKFLLILNQKTSSWSHLFFKNKNIPHFKKGAGIYKYTKFSEFMDNKLFQYR